MSNKTKRVLAAVLAVILVIATMLSIVTPLFADEIDDLERLQSELEAEAERARCSDASIFWSSLPLVSSVFTEKMLKANGLQRSIMPKSEWFSKASTSLPI